MSPYPKCEASTTCPLCGWAKQKGKMTCTRCNVGFKTIGPDFGKAAFERFEESDHE